MNPAKLDAAPVSVRMPMITPTTAHATPTPSACLAPSIRLARSECSVLRPPLIQKQAATSKAISPSTGWIPQRRNDDAPMPTAIQNT